MRRWCVIQQSPEPCLYLHLPASESLALSTTCFLQYLPTIPLLLLLLLLLLTHSRLRSQLDTWQYLVSLKQNRQRGTCGGDRYCDANAVCGVRCSEIDLIEANKHAIHMTAHTPNDGDGHGVGLGGSMSQLQSSVFGPGSGMIDTRHPSEAARPPASHLTR